MFMIGEYWTGFPTMINEIYLWIFSFWKWQLFFCFILFFFFLVLFCFLFYFFMFCFCFCFYLVIVVVCKVIVFCILVSLLLWLNGKINFEALHEDGNNYMIAVLTSIKDLLEKIRLMAIKRWFSSNMVKDCLNLPHPLLVLSVLTLLALPFLLIYN